MSEVPDLSGSGHNELRGIPAILGWQREALVDFIRHCAEEFTTEEDRREAVGVFLLTPTAMHSEDTAVWESRYHRLENIHVAPLNGFEIIETELLQKVAEQMDEWEAFFIMNGADMTQVKLMNPILGIGHSHPGGTALPSEADLEMFKVLREGRAKLGEMLTATASSKPMLSVEEHWICAFSSFGHQTLVSMSGDGNIKAQVSGDFVAEIQ